MPPFVVVTGGRSACKPWLSLISSSPWYLAQRCGGDESEMRIVLAAGQSRGRKPESEGHRITHGAELFVRKSFPGAGATLALHRMQPGHEPVLPISTSSSCARRRLFPDAADSHQGSGG
jgi:hypothetical protein